MIRYVVVKRIDPRTANETEPTYRYSAQSIDNEIIDIEGLATRIAQRCTVQRPDVEAALRAFVIVMRNNFLSGNSVRLDKVGVFKPTFRGSGADTEASWDTTYLKAINVRYRRASAIRQAMLVSNEAIKFEEVEKTGG